MNFYDYGTAAALTKLGIDKFALSLGATLRAAGKVTGEAGLHGIFEKMAPHEFEALKNYITSVGEGGVRADLWRTQPELAQRLHNAVGSFKPAAPPPPPPRPAWTPPGPPRSGSSAGYYSPPPPPPRAPFVDRAARRASVLNTALGLSMIGVPVGMAIGGVHGYRNAPWPQPMTRNRSTVRGMNLGATIGGGLPILGGLAALPFIR
jgi:hypothetical protein